MAETKGRWQGRRGAFAGSESSEKSYPGSASSSKKEVGAVKLLSSNRQRIESKVSLWSLVALGSRLLLRLSFK